jgi:DNA repair protein RecN (Recombination protein N)
MLCALRIRNFAIVESLDITFDDGLTVFTGETGAGKTILVEAIRFLTGGKAGTEMIRTSAAQMHVEGEFDAPDGNGHRIVLRREMNAQGTTRAFLDETQLAKGDLLLLGEQLADLCGQHQHQVLLDPDRHVDWLDRFAGTTDLVESVKTTVIELSEIARSLSQAQERIARRKNEEELRRFQIGEIRAANIEADEEERLKAEATVLKHARRLAEAAEMALRLLSDDDQSVETALGRIRREADTCETLDPRWTEIAAPLSIAIDSVADVTRAIAAYRDSLNFDPHRADQIEARLSEIYRLKTKYGGSCAAILERLAELEAEESSDEVLERTLAELREKSSALSSLLGDLAVELTQERTRAAGVLERSINEIIAPLGMARASLRVELSPYADGAEITHKGKTVHVHGDGAESVRFLFEANPAEGFKPLQKIASGGELSRLLLAFKAAVDGGSATNSRRGALPAPSSGKPGGGIPPLQPRACHREVQRPVSETDSSRHRESQSPLQGTGTWRSRSSSPLYIFDEIDSGIGGQTAHAVAAQIKALARNSQIFLITHLQQLATVADVHFRITKKTKAGRAHVVVERLESDERVRELARMIAGDDVTARTLEFAAELASPRKKPSKRP